MITRDQILKELRKHGKKDRSYKKDKVRDLIDQEPAESKEKILSDLESYADY